MTLWKILPLWALPRDKYFFIIIGAAFFGSISFSLIPQLHISAKFTTISQKLDRIHVDLFFCITFILMLILLITLRANQAWSWYRINTISLGFILFYAIFKTAPWQWLPFPARHQIGRLCLILTVGLYVIRAGFWGYTAVNAVADQRMGSFRMKGVVFAQQYAQKWEFNHLLHLIEEQYLYPEYPADSPDLPIDAESYVRLESGIAQAEAFRRGVITPNPLGITGADLLAKAMIRFKQLTELVLTDHPGLDNFDLGKNLIIQKIKGTDKRYSGPEIFGDFKGKWYGIWNDSEVNHDWNEVIVLDQPYEIKEPHKIFLRSFQYAWIGDGYGWNVIAAPESQDNGDVILGTVYHIIDGDPQQIRIRRPHVGIEWGEGRLIWLTTGEVFFEEIFTSENQKEDKYVITGFRYAIQNDFLEEVDDGFQAVYSRNPDKRTPFFTFPIDLRIQGE